MSALEWSAILVIGFTIGLWADYALGVLDKRHPITKHDRALAMSNEVQRLTERLQVTLEAQQLSGIEVEVLIAEASALIGRLVKRAGFPTMVRPSDPRLMLYCMHRYLFWVSPGLMAGDVKQARSSADVANSITAHNHMN